MIKPGTLLQNRYRVTKQIGQGGMGAVYVATDERFNSTVAIKQTLYDDPSKVRAFEREARLLNRLRHPALPRVSDYFSEGGGQFLVMEYVEGEDLGELLRQRRVPFPLAEVLRWADDLLDALVYLHGHEPPVVHRDIKPQNVRRTPEGRIVLLDFGLAKGMPEQTAAAPATSVFGYTRSFAPLEQMQASGTDPRSDIYSLAATLYHLMTGVLPADAMTRASATVKGQPDPLRPAHAAQAQVPAAVGVVLHRALSQNPALRQSSATELRAALRQAASAAPQGPLVASAAEADEKFQSTPFEATVVEPRAPAAQPQVAPRAPRPAPPQAVAALPSAAMRPADNPRRSVSRPEDSYTALAQRRPQQQQSGVSPMRIVGGLVAVLLFACAAAGSYLLIRPSAASPAASGAKADTRTGPQADPQAAPSAATGATVDGASAQSPRTPSDAQGPSAFSSSQPSNARAADEPRPSAQQSGTGAAAEALGAADANSVRAAAPSEADRTANAARPALVIQNPAPAPRPSEGPGPDEQRRAGDFQMRQPEFRPEDGRRPPPPDGRRPPPPDGRPHPPPPQHRPPPYR